MGSWGPWWPTRCSGWASRRGCCACTRGWWGRWCWPIALLTATLLLALLPASYWPRLWVLPPAALALVALGLWGSLYQAKPVAKALTFGNMRNNTSTLMSFLSIGTGAALYFLPWWWARLLLAGAVAASAWWPVRAVWRNDGALRWRLWRGIGA